MLNRRSLLGVVAIASGALISLPSWAADEAPDALVKRITGEVMAAVKADRIGIVSAGVGLALAAAILEGPGELAPESRMAAAQNDGAHLTLDKLGPTDFALLATVPAAVALKACGRCSASTGSTSGPRCSAWVK